MNADYIEALAQRIEAAKKPSPELDVEVACALRWARPDSPAWLREWKGDFAPLKGRAGHVCALHTDGSSGMNWKAEPVTSSLDAGRAMASARAPGLEWVTGRGKLKPDEPLYGACFYAGENTDTPVGTGESDHSEAAAFMAGLLRALARI